MTNLITGATAWKLEFHSHASWRTFAAAVGVPDADPEELFETLFGAGETCAFFVGTTLDAATWDLWDYDRFRAALTAAAPYCDGTVDVHDEDGGDRWRFRLADGRLHECPGRTVYPADPRHGFDLPEARRLVAGFRSGALDEADLAALAADPAGWLRDSGSLAAGEIRSGRHPSPPPPRGPAGLDGPPADPLTAAGQPADLPGRGPEAVL